MSLNTYSSEKYQCNMEFEKKRWQPNIESRIPEQPSPPRPALLIMWLLFVLGTTGTIIASNWNTPDSAIRVLHPHHTYLASQISTSMASPLPYSAPTSSCDPLIIRREWRTFSREEQSQYQTSVRCLMELPSKSGAGSRYSDFLQAHESAGWDATQTSDYLPWNRWYLHAFEAALRMECAYTGDMAYLDWTQAFDNSLQRSKDIPLSEGTTQSTLRNGIEAKPHLDAAVLGEILSAVDYDHFTQSLESRVQELAPLNFSNLDMPQDPLFLHQAQVDRLWWLWQQRHAELEILIKDKQIILKGLARNISVADVMKTESADLCYRYI